MSSSMFHDGSDPIQFSSLGSRLLKTRQQAKLTQREMADEIGCSHRTYRSYENDERSMPITTATYIILTFNLNAEWFHFGEKGRPNFSKKGADQ